MQRGIMSEHASPPSLSEVVQKLQQLIVREISREEAAAWAAPWMLKAEEFALDDRVLDRKIKKAICALAGADMPTSDREYLFEKIDFEAWLQELAE
jgi:hypothetical protein